MSPCRHCGADGSGLIFIHFTQEPGYALAACVCEKGKWWRTKYQLRAKAATLNPPPVEYGRLEEFYTEAELRVLKVTYEQRDLTSHVGHSGKIEKG